jgi:hypothetical protein
MGADFLDRGFGGISGSKRDINRKGKSLPGNAYKFIYLYEVVRRDRPMGVTVARPQAERFLVD